MFWEELAKENLPFNQVLQIKLISKILKKYCKTESFHVISGQYFDDEVKLSRQSVFSFALLENRFSQC